MYLVLGEGHANEVNDSVGESEKSSVLTFTKSKTKFCLIFH